MDLTQYLRVVRRRWRIILTTFLGVLAIAALLTTVADRQYRATAQLYISTVSADNPADLAQGSNYTQRQVATYTDIVTAPLVLDPVVERLGLDLTSRQLVGKVTATAPAGTVLIDIAVTDQDPQQALDIADAVSDQLVTTLETLDQVDESQPSPVKATVVAPAAVGALPVSPQPARNLALGAVLGLLLGFGAGLLRDLLDTSVRGEPDVKLVDEHLTVIGGIAFDKAAAEKPLIVQDDPHSTRSEAFRTLRTNLQFVDVSHSPKVIVFTSSLPGEGKSTTTANLALTLANTGGKVCVIEGDLRRPKMLEYMGLESTVGLTNVLIGEAEVEDVLQPFGGNSLSVLGCGPIPPNPSELLGSEAMASLLTDLRSRFDYVVIDAPPLLPVTDAAVLSKLVDGTIVVVGAGVIKREHLSRALTALDNVGAHVLGIVMNRLPTRGADAYGYYYGDGYSSRGADSPSHRGGRFRRRDKATV